MKVVHHLRWLVPLASLGVSGFAWAEPFTPDEALARAAARSPELSAALYDIKSATASVDAEDRVRDPVLSGSLHATQSDRTSLDGSLGVRTTTDIGTEINIGVNSSFDTARDATTLNPDPSTSSSATVGVDIRQPLLRGGGTDAVLAALRQAKLSRSSAQVDRDKAASTLAADVLSAYWEVWFSAKALDVERASLTVTEQQVSDMRKRVDILKTAPATDALRLESELASQRGAVSRAEADLETQQITLARLLGISYAEASAIVASGDPEANATVPTLADLIPLAEAESYQLRTQRMAIESQKIGVHSAEDAAQPRLDFVASVSAGALWDDQFSGFDFQGGRPGIIAMIGLEGELPFGKSDEDARLDGAKARLGAAQARYQAASEELGAQVARTRRSLVEAEDAAQIATETARISRELADKEASKLKLGTSVVTDLVLAQQQARSADLQALRARANVETTRIALDELTGSLLARVASVHPNFTATAKDI